jgi:hypothetical protein
VSDDDDVRVTPEALDAALETYLDSIDLAPLMTIDKTRAVLDVSRRTVYRLIDEGRLERVLVAPHTPRITRRSVRRLIEGKLPAIEERREREALEGVEGLED